MTPEQSSADDDGPDDESGDGDAETVGSDEAEPRRPSDPVLIVARGAERALRGVDRTYARLETLPGRVRFGLSVLTFVASAHFGAAIHQALDVLAGRTVAVLLTEFMAFSPGVRVVLVLTVVLVGQVAVANEKLTKIAEIVETVTDDGTVTDGGVRTCRVDTTGAWAHGGAALGAGFGALFGFATIFGGMISGAIVGDLVEEWSAKRRKRRRLETEVVEYLLRERVFESNPVETETVRGLFPADDEEFVVEAIAKLLRDDDAPLDRSPGGIYLTGAPEAVAYLDRNGGRVPAAFAGPNRPPRPSDASE